MIAAIDLFIAGRVHGVGFRAFVVSEARRQALRGWVRNRRDGRVEVRLLGDNAAVAKVVDACRRGPPAARVDHIEEHLVTDDGTPDFSERPTV